MYENANIKVMTEMKILERKICTSTSCHNSIQPEILESLSSPSSLSLLLPTQPASSQVLFLFSNPLLCQSIPLWRSKSWKVSGTNYVLMAEKERVSKIHFCDCKLPSVGFMVKEQTQENKPSLRFIFGELISLSPKLPDSYFPFKFHYSYLNSRNTLQIWTNITVLYWSRTHPVSPFLNLSCPNER